MISETYLKQVELLLKILPIVNKQKCFSLKGGTAINLFLQNMPRLSVDIDLTYTPIEPRNIFIQNITDALNILSKNINDSGRGEYHAKPVFTAEVF
ncbi:MAG: nucleotidyl transferase AbiEii/AbiGii toxin family protein [Gammaproteobacteria bacterium]